MLQRALGLGYEIIGSILIAETDDDTHPRSLTYGSRTAFSLPRATATGRGS